MKRSILLSFLLILPVLAWCAPSAQVTQMTGDFHATLQQRQLEDKYAGMAAYFADRLDNSAGTKTFSDKTGNCRLSWFDWMMRHPIESVGAADEFTQRLHQAVNQRQHALPDVIRMAAEKLDAPVNERAPAAMTRTGGDPDLETLTRILISTRQQFDAALAPLTPAECAELEAKLFVQSTGPAAEAPFFADQKEGRRVCDLLEKIDRRALMGAAASVAELTELDAWVRMEGLFKQPRTAPETIETPVGKIILGSVGADTYDLAAMDDVCAILDPNGDDTYIEGTVSADRPVLVIMDLRGNDTYRGTQPGIQGGAILGVSMLLDGNGDDVYQAGSVAQGAALAGVGILADGAGNDRYIADTRVQGSAVCGIGLLLDRFGNDDYRGALLAQGVGGPLGFGLLDDLAGNDHYYAGGKYPDGYDDSPGYNGWSQGAGVGPRGVANGGIGVLLDGGGDDIYEADYFSHGGGYWFALGFARDFGGNDQRLGSTRTAWDGSERKEARFLRYGNGFGVHYAAGYLIDDAGDDSYLTTFAGTGFTWDIGITALLDFDGNDHYQAGSGVGACYNTGLMVLFDAKGDDTYDSPNAGLADAKSEYHPDDARAYNFTLLLDLAGQDTYPKVMQNGTEGERGWAGGIFIDK